jgi:hypothetical protein
MSDPVTFEGGGRTVLLDDSDSMLRPVQFVAPDAPPIVDGDFFAPGYDFETLTGPRVTVDEMTTITAPQTTNTRAAVTHLPPEHIITAGPHDALHIAAATTYDQSLVLDKYPTAVILKAATTFTDSLIEASLVGSDVTLEHSTVDTSGAMSQPQGSVYQSSTARINNSKVDAFWDALWIGEHTRPRVFKRYAQGDFYPFASFVYRSQVKQTTVSFGNATYSPDYYNVSANPDSYPLKETPGVLAAPVGRGDIDAAIPTSWTVGTACHVGDFLRLPAGPAPPGTKFPSGVNGGLWQVIGSTSTTNRSPTAAVTTGAFSVTGWQLGFATFSKFSRPGPNPKLFVSGTAIIIYIGSANHSDMSQFGHANGHTLWLESEVGADNAATFICQATNPPVSHGDKNDTSLWPTAYMRVERCLCHIATRLAYVQAKTDAVRGGFPPSGYRAAPWWVTFKDCWLSTDNDVIPRDTRLLYAPSSARVPVFVSNEGRRYDGVLTQLDETGRDMMRAARGGRMPTGQEIVDDESGLGNALREAEWLGTIVPPQDGIGGMSFNLSDPSLPYAARLAYGLRTEYLDARGWVVWDSMKTVAAQGSELLIHPIYDEVNKRPWLYRDGRDLGYYTGPVA